MQIGAKSMESEDGVVFKDGAICDSYVFGGPEMQKRLLEQEGVPFLDDTHVDMAKCAWTPGDRRRHTNRRSRRL